MMKEKKAKNGRPLRDLNICISQYANPERSEIRKKALKLGARYSPQFSNNVTHVIVPLDSIQSVPKVLKALSSGKKVVSRKWLDECEKTNSYIFEANEYRVFGKENLGSFFSEEELKKIEEKEYAGLNGWKELFIKKYSSKLEVFEISNFAQTLITYAGDEEIEVYVDEEVNHISPEELNKIAYLGKRIKLLDQGFGLAVLLGLHGHCEVVKENIFGFLTVSELMKYVAELEKKTGRSPDTTGLVCFEGFRKIDEIGTYSPIYGS